MLILDEPLASLDLRNQREIVRLMERINTELGVTILVVAHDLNPLLPILTGAIYLLDGHPHFDTLDGVVDQDLLSHLYGTPVEVVHTPQGDLYVRRSW
jgi:zinc/manganese transport system ATP-binding protein